ncbi:hypothetical protein FQN57_000479 [Myotisia sp. PD_48]|nr:hypothetical protein FQN57_000479 [Myotisia sp. PD_48]
MSDTEALVQRISASVADHMKDNDPSHDIRHVSRVVSLAQNILAKEQTRDPSVQYNQTIVTLAAWLHDLADRKYLPDNQQINPTTIIRDTLLSHGADPATAEKVQTIVSNISYSTEIKNPEAIRHLITHGFPEIAIVQDADRLDALGAIGIGRCFTYLGARTEKTSRKRTDGADGTVGREQNQPVPCLDEAIEHFKDKLEKLEGMMKTESGREMARVRARRIIEFRHWWEEEVGDLEKGDQNIVI